MPLHFFDSVHSPTPPPRPHARNRRPRSCQPVPSGDGPLAQRRLGVRRRRGRHRRARRRHGRLQRRRGRERHRRERRVERHDAGAEVRARALQDRHPERPDARRAAAAAADRVGEQGHLRGRAGAARVRGHGHDDRRVGVLRQSRVDRAHRRLALLPPARREVRAADARPLAAAGADRQRRAHARAGALFAQQEPRHARAGHRGDRRRPTSRIPDRGERHLPAVLRRPDRHGRPRGDPHDRRRKAQRPGGRGGRADRPREPERRPRQHLGDPGPRAARVPAVHRVGAALAGEEEG